MTENKVFDKFKHFFNKFVSTGMITKKTHSECKNKLIDIFKTNYREIASSNNIQINVEDLDNLDSYWDKLVNELL